MGAIEGVDLVPAGRKRLKVLSPSVFTQDDLVLRDILPGELMDAYDVEVTVQDALKEASRIHSLPLSLAFALEAPGKLLTAVGQAVLKGLLNPCPLKMESKNDEANLASDKVCPPIFSVAAKALDTQGLDSMKIDPVAKEVSTEPDVKAAKEDDAAVNFRVWDKRSVENFNDTTANHGALICIKGTYCKETHGWLFDAFRVLLLRRYQRNLMRSFLKYLHEKHGNSARQTQMSVQKFLFGPWRKNEKQELVYFVSKWAARGTDNGKLGKAKQQKSKSKSKTSELDKDIRVGRDALQRAANCTWWNWDAGSNMFFWRWALPFQAKVRDGTPLFIYHSSLPSNTSQQQDNPDPARQEQLKKKVNGLRTKTYIDSGFVLSVLNYFGVPKGETDIRMVFDTTPALWTPNFFLATIKSVMMNADAETWMGDLDLGEMFLNFWLDEQLRPYARVDVTSLGKRELNENGDEVFVHRGLIRRIWERWERTCMGLKSSPYVCTQTFGWCEDAIRGNWRETNNPFRWDEVVLNLPGAKDYQPEKPWVYRLCSKTGKLAAFFGTYIDDCQSGASTERGC